MGAALAAGVLTTGVLTAASHTQTMVVSTQYLAPWQPITAADVRVVTVPQDNGLGRLATQPQQVIGKYLEFPVPSGYPITAADVSETTSYSSFLTQYEHQFGVSGYIVAMAPTSPLANLINTGEQIGLQIGGGNGPSGPPTLYQPIPVVGVLRGTNGQVQTLLLFLSQTLYPVLSPDLSAGGGSAQIVLIPQTGTYPLRYGNAVAKAAGANRSEPAGVTGSSQGTQPTRRHGQVTGSSGVGRASIGEGATAKGSLGTSARTQPTGRALSAPSVTPTVPGGAGTKQAGSKAPGGNRG